MPVVARTHHDSQTGLKVREDIKAGTVTVTGRRGERIVLDGLEGVRSLYRLLMYVIVDHEDDEIRKMEEER